MRFFSIGHNGESSIDWCDEIPSIHHGETIMDRKSVFQAHVAKVVSVKQVTYFSKLIKYFRKYKIGFISYHFYLFS